MTTPQLTTPGDVDQEIIECWRLLLKAEEAGRHLTVDEHGEYNEAWVDAADALLAAGIVVSARARVLPLWSPVMGRLSDSLVRSSFLDRTVDTQATGFASGSDGQRTTPASTCDGDSRFSVSRGRSLSSWAMASKPA